MVRKSISAEKNLSSRSGRREFLKQTGLGLAGVVAGSARYARGEELRAAKIVPGKIPEFVPGKLRMKWADQAMIGKAAELHPFDLQRRMILAANAQTTCVDPNLGYLSYSGVNFQTRPPYLHHMVGDFVDDTGRHTDSLHLTQSATGDHGNAEVVQKIAENAMDDVDQGIAWNPHQDPFTWWNTTDKDRPKGRWAHLPENTRVILGMMSYYRATGDRRGLETARSMVHAFYEVAEKNDKYLWYPDFNYEQLGNKILPMRVVNGTWRNMVTNAYVHGRIDPSDPKSGTGDMGGNFPAAFMGMMLEPVLRYYEDTKDPLAGEMVMKFSRLVIDLMPTFIKDVGQTDSSIATIGGIFQAGQVLGVLEFRDWAEEAYRNYTAQDYVTDFGWTPENTGRPRVKGLLACETCSTVDYLEAAMRLALYRNGKYWDDVERIAMNQLLEGQMLRIDFVERIPAKDIKPLPKLDPKWMTTDHVLERSLGCLSGFCGPNDWVQVGLGDGFVQCCFGSGPRGLYDTWHCAAQEEGDTVKVNLQFSKRLPSALITSYMPGKATLEIEMTHAKKLQVRKPGWVSPEQTKVFVDGEEKKVQLAGSYFDLGHLPGGSKVRMQFPDETTRRTERIGEVEFRTVWRGNAVVEMDPAGEIYPLYQGRDRKDGVKPLAFINSNPVNPL